MVRGLIIGLCVFSSCNVIVRHLDNALYDAGSMMLTPIVVTQLLAELTMAIHEKDSLEHGNPLYIHQLNALLTGKTGMFELQVDSMEVTLKDDSIILRSISAVRDKFISYTVHPITICKNSYAIEDSMTITATCQYLFDMNIQSVYIEYMHSNYTMKNLTIIRKDDSQ